MMMETSTLINNLGNGLDLGHFSINNLNLNNLNLNNLDVGNVDLGHYSINNNNNLNLNNLNNLNNLDVGNVDLGHYYSMLSDNNNENGLFARRDGARKKKFLEAKHALVHGSGSDMDGVEDVRALYLKSKNPFKWLVLESNFGSLKGRVGIFDEKFLKEVLNAGVEGRISLLEEGMGGTYLLQDKMNASLGIFKPGEEEAGSPVNPKGNFVCPKKNIKPGEGYIREIAAYMMDHEHFAGVPLTQLVEIEVEGKNKLGSLQKYVANKGNMTEWSSSLFSVSDVLKIAQLDVRMFNMDRNDENMLVVQQNGKNHLVPIDHAYTLPEGLDCAWFDWMNWKQAREPIPKDIADYIERIDIDKDEKILRSLNLSEESINVMIMSTHVLKIGVKNGYNMHEIALFLSRPNKTDLSPIEEVVKSAKEKGEDKFMVNYVALVNEKFPVKKP